MSNVKGLWGERGRVDCWAGDLPFPFKPKATINETVVNITVFFYVS